MSEDILSHLPDLPADEGGPVFKEPWQAQAFAMAVKLQEQGVFTWAEWAEEMNRSIQNARAEGDPDLGNTYYRHWLATLERIMEAHGLCDAAERNQHQALVKERHQALHSHKH